MVYLFLKVKISRKYKFQIFENQIKKMYIARDDRISRGMSFTLALTEFSDLMKIRDFFFRDFGFRD